MASESIPAQKVESSNIEHDYADYHWGEEEQTDDKPELQQPVFEIERPKESLFPVEPSKPELKTEAKIKSAVDPVASLHAALGLLNNEESSSEQQETATSVTIEDTPDKTKAAAAAFSTSIENELEETTKAPLELAETVELEAQTSADEAESLTESLVAELQQSAPPAEEKESTEEVVTAANLSIDLENTQDEWAKTVVKLGLVGTLEQIAYSSQFDWLDEDKIGLKVNPKLDLICTDSAKAGIEETLTHHFDKKLTFDWVFAEAERETPAMIFERLAKEKHQKACESLDAHPFSQELKQHFSAQLIPQSVGYLN